MRKIILLCSYLLLAICSYGQSYFKYKYAGDSLYNVKRYKESGIAYNNAFKIRSGSYLHYYSAACSWALAGNKKQAFICLNKAIDLGFDDKETLLEDKDLAGLHNSKDWDIFINKVDKAAQSRASLLDTALIKKLQVLAAKDQMLRSVYQCIADKFADNTIEKKSFNELLSLQDSLNFISFEKSFRRKTGQEWNLWARKVIARFGYYCSMGQSGNN
jgi:tetratricopeptide (TPR) repeat protein